MRTQVRTYPPMVSLKPVCVPAPPVSFYRYEMVHVRLNRNTDRSQYSPGPPVSFYSTAPPVSFFLPTGYLDYLLWRFAKRCEIRPPS